MKNRTTAAMLVFLPLVVFGIIACGTDSGEAAVTQIGVVADEVPIVAVVDETLDDGDAHTIDIVDEHDDSAVVATALAEHDLTPHAGTIEEDHEEADTEASEHAHAMGSVDADAPVVHFFASEFGYETATTEVEAGHGFTIMLHNDGVLEHDITFEGLEDQGGIHLQPGEDSMATFTINEPGEYTYYCTVPGHREAGMTGLLTVVADDHGAELAEATHEDGHDEDEVEATHDDDQDADATEATHEDDHDSDAVEATHDDDHDADAVEATNEDDHDADATEATHEDDHDADAVEATLDDDHDADATEATHEDDEVGARA